MKHLLSAENAHLLEHIAASRVLLAFDFDGTLAPIAYDRHRVSMRARTRHLFTRLCDLYPCAVISGRSRPDVQSRLAGAAIFHVVGNHGIEPGTTMEEASRCMRQAAPLLAEALAKVTGLDIEDKTYSLAVHYRRARRKAVARAAILEAVARLAAPVRAVLGKSVVNVVPADSPHKGDALLHLRQLAQADSAFYVGDDVTDEDIFALDEPGRLLTVRIGASTSSAAGFYLRRQEEIDVLLERLIQLRETLVMRGLE